MAVTHVVVDQVARALAIQDSRWAIFAACAAAGAAVATAILALITSNLANATREMSSATKDMVAKTAALGEQTAKQIANEHAKHQVDNTIKLMNRFLEKRMYASEDTRLPAAVASFKIVEYGRNLQKLHNLIEARALNNAAAENEYATLVSCCAIFDNLLHDCVPAIEQRGLGQKAFHEFRLLSCTSER